MAKKKDGKRIKTDDGKVACTCCKKDGEPPPPPPGGACPFCACDPLPFGRCHSRWANLSFSGIEIYGGCLNDTADVISYKFQVTSFDIELANSRYEIAQTYPSVGFGADVWSGDGCSGSIIPPYRDGFVNLNLSCGGSVGLLVDTGNLYVPQMYVFRASLPTNFLGLTIPNELTEWDYRNLGGKNGSVVITLGDETGQCAPTTCCTDGTDSGPFTVYMHYPGHGDIPAFDQLMDKRNPPDCNWYNDFDPDFILELIYDSGSNTNILTIYDGSFNILWQGTRSGCANRIGAYARTAGSEAGPASITIGAS